ncbi:MAG: PAS domain S-box protein [Halioglobus sp.]|nr:PAS domain S-box protein [Halioglobus sp.]
MLTSISEPAVYTQLRDKAEAQLAAGTTPPTTHCAMSVDALRLLHRLAGNPETADDALRFLHELQVHQVELDLQNEEIAANERAMVEELSRYRALYECAPLAYFILDHDGIVIEGNPAASELFGVAGIDLGGRRIDTLLTPEFRPLLGDLLRRVVNNGGRASCAVPRQPGPSGARPPLQFLASALPGSGFTLLACCECASVG